MKVDIIRCPYISKRMTKKALQSYHLRTHSRARLTVCKLGIFSRQISQLSKIHPPTSLRSHLGSLPTGIFSRDYVMVTYICNTKSTRNGIYIV